MNSESNPAMKEAMASPTSTQIFEHQQAAHTHLTAVAKACFFTNRQSLPMRLRTNTLLIGPSGSGKTHLARALAAGGALLSLSTQGWMILGSNGKGGGVTWPLIVGFLDSHHSADGIIIFLDEICKLNPNLGAGASLWENAVKTEIFALLDHQIPTGMTDVEGNPISRHSLKQAQTVLKEKTFIIAAGAFQQLVWERPKAAAIGFSHDTSASNTLIVDLNTLATHLPRELINRFSTSVVVLPQMIEADYRRMLQTVGNAVPHYLRETFLRLGNERIAAALECQQGCRFLEDVLLETIIYERSVMANPELEVTCLEKPVARTLDASII